MDKVEQCVSEVVAIAMSSGELDHAEHRVTQLFTDAAAQGEHFTVAQKLRDQLARSLNAQEGAPRQFLEDMIDGLVA
jgi:hypothetical protein